MIAINKDVINTIFWVHDVFKGRLTFCGSVGLAFNNLLNRPVHDVDVITDFNYYGVAPEVYIPGYDWQHNSDLFVGKSAKFYVGGKLVKCFKLCSPTGINVDVMFREDKTNFQRKEYLGKVLRIEEPLSCIQVKLEYLIRWQEMEGCTGKSVSKHRADVDYYKQKQGLANDYEILR